MYKKDDDKNNFYSVIRLIGKPKDLSVLSWC